MCGPQLAHNMIKICWHVFWFVFLDDAFGMVWLTVGWGSDAEERELQRTSDGQNECSCKVPWIERPLGGVGAFTPWRGLCPIRHSQIHLAFLASVSELMASCSEQELNKKW